ncbi:MAG: MqnA/MqnD/SBP family protein [Rhodothermales bacterium]
MVPTPTKIAVWNAPFTMLAASALRDSPGVDLQLGTSVEAEVLLRAGRVDVALLPTDRILMAGDDFDVLPAVGISTWSNPFARLVLENGLPDAEASPVPELHIRCQPDGALAGLVARIVLKEHYGMIAKVTPPLETDEWGEGGAFDLLASPADASRTSPFSSTSESDSGSLDVGAGPSKRVELDLGQEWYELANYPMVWAAFVMRKGEVEDAHIQLVRDVLVELDENRRTRVLAAGGTEAMQQFELNELRLRMDDLAIASLTELGEYMYFYELKETIDPVAFASLTDNE